MACIGLARALAVDAFHLLMSDKSSWGLNSSGSMLNSYSHVTRWNTWTFSSKAVKTPNLAADLFISEHVSISQNLVFPPFSVNMMNFLWCFITTFNVTLFPKLESFEMWCWRRIQKISWTDRVRN